MLKYNKIYRITAKESRAMLDKVERFFEKNNVIPAQIMYVTREGRQTLLTLDGGRIADCYIPIKYIYGLLPVGSFLNITKGVLINRKYISTIEDGTYTMTDGRCFRGRVRTRGAHKYNSRMHASGNTGGMLHDSHSMHSHFSVLDNCPMPFCAVELIYDSTGRIVDFVFKYVNQAMADFEGKTREEMMDVSYYELFTDRDHKWLDMGKETIDRGAYLEANDYSERNGVYVRTFNYAIRPGLVGCVVQILDTKDGEK